MQEHYESFDESLPIPEQQEIDRVCSAFEDQSRPAAAARLTRRAREHGSHVE